jgi:K+-transporting ATPase ATPase A chain
MLGGRFLVVIPTLALAGSFAAKPRNDAPHGALRTDSVLFGVLLVAVIGIVGALTFLPGDALGPIAGQLDLVAHTLRQ